MFKDMKEKGKQKINEIMPGGADKLLNGLGKISPDMAENVLGYIFGNLYSREGFDLKTKQLLTVTILATLGNAQPQLKYHINGALNIGIAQDDIINVMIHISGYAGFPAALNGINAAKEVFAEREKTKEM